MILKYWLGFGLEFALQIARQALEQRLFAELEEKDETFFTVAYATLDLCALGEKQELWVEVVPNRKREWLDFKTDSEKDFWVEKLELLESFEDCRELKELIVELCEERGGKSAKLYENVPMWMFWKLELQLKVAPETVVLVSKSLFSLFFNVSLKSN